MGAYGALAVLILGGWSFLDARVSWAYIAVAVGFEFWLARRVAAAGKGPPASGEAPYHFTEEEAAFIGAYRFYFTTPEVARQASSVLSAIGLSSLLLMFWLTYKAAFVQAALVGANLFLVARFTKLLVPILPLRVRANRGDRAALRLLELHEPLWAKIHAANRESPGA